MDKLTFLQRIANVQSTLNAPKNQFNKFGNYKYRNLEDILEAAKPLLKANDIVLTLDDTIEVIGDKWFLKATGKLTDALNASEQISTTAYVELSEHKGMSTEQALGTASSYCRKYCLGGLLLVDDNKDPDTNEFAQQTGKAAAKPAAKPKSAAKHTPTKEEKQALIAACKEKNIPIEEVLEVCKVQGEMTLEQYNAAINYVESKEVINE